jgi:hypothetical protein
MLLCIIEISVKSGKDSTSSLSFSHTQGEIQKKPAKEYMSIQGGGGNSENYQFWW